jgi:hypothetical protein
MITGSGLTWHAIVPVVLLMFGYCSTCMVIEFYYGVYNQCESFIRLDLMVKNRDVSIEMYFKWWIGTKLVCVRYQNY